MGIILFFIATYLLPFISIAFVINSISLAKKIKKGDGNTAPNTFWVTLTFTIIVCCIVWLPLLST